MRYITIVEFHFLRCWIILHHNRVGLFDSESMWDYVVYNSFDPLLDSYHVYFLLVVQYILIEYFI